MPDDVTGQIADSIIHNTITLDRFAEGTKNKVFSILTRAQNELAGAIAEIDPHSPTMTKWREERYRKLHARISEIVDSAYKDAKKETNIDLKGMITPVAGKTVTDMNLAIGANLFDVTLTQENLKSIVTKTMIDGHIIGDWWDRQNQDTKDRIIQQMNLVKQQLEVGMVKGESINELVGRIRGTALSPGVMGLSKREAEALVRTSVHQVAGNTRMQIYKQNEDILKGYEVIATLDKRTTPLCRAMDRRRYDLNFKPIGHSMAYPGGGPPFHWNCRSTIVPITKSYQDLADEDSGLSKKKRVSLTDTPIGKRAAMGGPVTGRYDYNDWLKLQSEAVQQSVLGIKRQQLWKDNKLTMVDLVHQNGRQLTLPELKDLIGDGSAIAMRKEVLLDQLAKRAFELSSMDEFDLYMNNMPDRQEALKALRERKFTTRSFYDDVKRSEVLGDDLKAFLLQTDDALFATMEIEESISGTMVTFGGRVTYDLTDPIQKAQFEKIRDAYLVKYKSAMVKGLDPSAAMKTAFSFLDPKDQEILLRKIEASRLKAGVATKVVPRVEVIPETITVPTTPKIIYKEITSGIEARRALKSFGIENIMVKGDPAAISTAIRKLNLIGKDFERMYAEYPEIAVRMKRYNVYDWIMVDGPRTKPGGKAWGDYTYASRRLRLAQVPKEVDKWRIGEYSADNITAVARHELGHHLWAEWSPELKYEWETLYGTHKKKWWKDRVTGYGGSKVRELWAESFRIWTAADYGMPGKTNLPPQIEEFLMKLYPKVKPAVKIAEDLLEDQKWVLDLANPAKMLEFKRGDVLPASIFKALPDGWNPRAIAIKMEDLPGDMPVVGTKWHSVGNIMIEDGKVWIAQGEDGKWMFPKGAKMGDTPELGAMRVTYQRTGMAGDINAYLGDYERGSSITRYYIGERTGGIPGQAGLDVRLVPLKDVAGMVGSEYDRIVARDLLERYESALRLGKGDVKVGLAKLNKEAVHKSQFEEFMLKLKPVVGEDLIKFPDGLTYEEKLIYAKRAADQTAKASLDAWKALDRGAYATAIKETGVTGRTLDDYIKVKKLGDEKINQARAKRAMIKRGSAEFEASKRIGTTAMDDFSIWEEIETRAKILVKQAEEDILDWSSRNKIKYDSTFYMEYHPKPDDMDMWQYRQTVLDGVKKEQQAAADYLLKWQDDVGMDRYEEMFAEMRIKFPGKWDDACLTYKKTRFEVYADKIAESLTKIDDFLIKEPLARDVYDGISKTITVEDRLKYLIKGVQESKAVTREAGVATTAPAPGTARTGLLVKDIPASDRSALSMLHKTFKGGSGTPGSGTKMMKVWESLDPSEHKRYIDDWTGKGISVPADFRTKYYATGPTTVPIGAATPKTIPPTMIDTKIELKLSDFKEYDGGGKGSNPGGYFHSKENPADRYYFKFLDDDDKIYNEILANKLYKLSGVDCPEVGIVVDANGKKGLASRIIDGVEKNASKLQRAGLTGVEDNFIVDCWLSNWDVVGGGYDNMLIKDGIKVVRADNGGSLRYRARGGKKGAEFGKDVKEIDTLRNARINPESASVFKRVSSDHMKIGAKKVISVTDKQIRDLVEEYGGPLTSSEKRNLADILIGRRDYIREYFADTPMANLNPGGIPELKPLQTAVIDVAAKRGAITNDLIVGLKRQGLTETQIKKLQTNVAQQMRVCTNIPLEDGEESEVYRALFKEPTLKNQFVRGGGGEGAHGPYKGSGRDDWEKWLSNGLFQVEKVYQDMPSGHKFIDKAERLEHARMRPYYGYVLDTQNIHCASQYGDFTCVMNKGIENRSTFTIGNSSGRAYGKGGLDPSTGSNKYHGSGKSNAPLLRELMEKLSKADLKALADGTKTLNQLGINYRGYVEAQMYGTFRLDRDVEFFVWHRGGIPDYIRKFANRYGKEVITQDEWRIRAKNIK